MIKKYFDKKESKLVKVKSSLCELNIGFCVNNKLIRTSDWNERSSLIIRERVSY